MHLSLNTNKDTQTIPCPRLTSSVLSVIYIFHICNHKSVTQLQRQNSFCQQLWMAHFFAFSQNTAAQRSHITYWLQIVLHYAERLCSRWILFSGKKKSPKNYIVRLQNTEATKNTFRCHCFDPFVQKRINVAFESINTVLNFDC